MTASPALVSAFLVRLDYTNRCEGHVAAGRVDQYRLGCGSHRAALFFVHWAVVT